MNIKETWMITVDALNQYSRVFFIRLQSSIIRFYNCAGCLMTRQLQNLTVSSLVSFAELFVQPQNSVLQYGHSGLIVRILLDGQTLKYEPDFDEFEASCARRFESVRDWLPWQCLRRLVKL